MALPSTVNRYSATSSVEVITCGTWAIKRSTEPVPLTLALPVKPVISPQDTGASVEPVVLAFTNKFVASDAICHLRNSLNSPTCSGPRT